MKRTLLAVLLCAAIIAPAGAASYDDLNAGMLSEKSGEWADAVAYFDKALAAGGLVPGLQYVAHLDRGRAHLALGYIDLAIADYGAALALRPNDPVALSGRSLALFQARKFDEAVRDIDSVIAAYPFHNTAYLQRAAINARRGRVADSLADLKTVRARAPGDTGLYQLSGILGWQAGDIAGADSDFAAALEKNSGIYSWMWLSLTQARLGKPVPKRSLPDFDEKQWPAPIVDLFLGKTSRDAVFAAAAQAGGVETPKGQVCEANFYVGEWLLQHQDAASAGPLIRKAAGDCPEDFVEWAPAQSELKNLP